MKEPSSQAVGQVRSWAPAPNSWHLTCSVTPDDPKPADPYTGDWWSGWRAEVKRVGKGEWEWRVWRPLRHASGQAADWGTASSAKAAQLAASFRLIELMVEAGADVLPAIDVAIGQG
ncbi:hypothetical protein [Azospirillum doebereinerae]|uniref:Uncharacterized protein n=1 Tax=Azospirillum doebereinerae TaxID=92933 RepID=A0A433J2T9_9PROT|nr:hypothetical protein [Azospirillum doebereinerae]RUQ66013.1 hypothetical protein EJ913_24560 [Azospirillum doebereinerae]